MEQDRHREVAKLALQTLEMKGGDLCPWQEQNTLKKALGRTGVVKPFAEGLHHLLYGDFDAALGSLAALLKPHDAAKWTLLTFWPFFRFPGRQMFMKPTVVQDCAVRLGYELHYEPTPNQKTYHSPSGSQHSCAKA